MIRLSGIRHQYDGKLVLEVADFTAEEGAHWLLLGQSGSGKTTLLHIIAGLLQPSEGTVEVAGQRLESFKGSALDRFRGRQIGIVFQKIHLLPTLTIIQNLLISQQMAGLKQDKHRAREVLDTLGLSDRRNAWPHQLSSGQQQRVGIARAVINRPKVLLADEPTSALDDLHAEQVAQLLTEQAQLNQATLLISTHDQRLRSRFGNHYSLEPATAV